jgi:2,3-bisphosphoglycerate-independent phosphoglycerate mutase
VPLVIVGGEGRLASGGTLADVAPTALGIQGIERTKEMTGRDLRK